MHQIRFFVILYHWSITYNSNNVLSILCLNNQPEIEDNPPINETNDIDDFEYYLQNNSINVSQSSDANPSFSQGSQGSIMSLNWLKTKLEDFSKLDRLPYKEDLLMFWMEKKDEMPEILELAQILMAVPGIKCQGQGYMLILVVKSVI